MGREINPVCIMEASVQLCFIALAGQDALPHTPRSRTRPDRSTCMWVEHTKQGHAHPGTRRHTNANVFVFGRARACSPYAPSQMIRLARRTTSQTTPKHASSQSLCMETTPTLRYVYICPAMPRLVPSRAWPRMHIHAHTRTHMQLHVLLHLVHFLHCMCTQAALMPHCHS